MDQGFKKLKPNRTLGIGRRRKGAGTIHMSNTRARAPKRPDRRHTSSLKVEKGGNSHNPTLPIVPLRVWLAEDEEGLRRVLARTLERKGIVVRKIKNGYELLDRLNRVHAGSTVGPDVLLTDLSMPGGTAIKVLEQLNAWNLQMRVVVMTATFDHAAQDKVRQLGAEAVFEKPFSVPDLVGALLNSQDESLRKRSRPRP